MKNEFEKTPIDLAAVREAVLRVVAESAARVTPPALEKMLIKTCGLTKKQVREVIRDLVADGELAYTYEFGTTFLEISFNKPVRISSRVVLKPPGHHYQPATKDIVIEIKPGAAFGDGRHPTSRLAVRGIEHVFNDYSSNLTAGTSRILDIGTGSGVLVLTAVAMGIDKGVGIDIDPAARSEARANELLNQLGDRIEISDLSLESIDGVFSLVTANLRYPTLKNICSILKTITCPEGFLVCSGIRGHELTGLIKAYEVQDFNCLWSEQSHDWAGCVLKKVF